MRIDNKTIDGRTNDFQVVGKIIELKIKSLRSNGFLLGTCGGFKNLEWEINMFCVKVNFASPISSN